MDDKLKQFMQINIPKIESSLNGLLATVEAPDTLKSSMAYSVNAGGKRIRPILVLATLRDLDVVSDDAWSVACAIELIHTYSLIHDDLPCMDDDDFRRGKPTNHKVYGEAMAVLAGDALQALAFRAMTELSDASPKTTIELIRLLADAAGAQGMVGGQVLDIEGEEQALTLDALEAIHLNKTGALLTFCIEAGAILAQVDEVRMGYLRTFAKNIGLAFQIQDDILDVTSTTEALGKNAGSDETLDKMTYPALLGLEGAQTRLAHHHALAIEALTFVCGDREDSLLASIANYIIKRTH